MSFSSVLNHAHERRGVKRGRGHSRKTAVTVCQWMGYSQTENATMAVSLHDDAENGPTNALGHHLAGEGGPAAGLYLAWGGS